MPLGHSTMPVGVGNTENSIIVNQNVFMKGYSDIFSESTLDNFLKLPAPQGWDAGSSYVTVAT